MNEAVIEENEVQFSEKFYKETIEKGFKIIKDNAHPETGFFPAADPHINTPESKEDHMQDSWIRDFAMNHIGMIESCDNLRQVYQKSELIEVIKQFVNTDMTKAISFLNQPRWVDKFKQEIADRGQYTELTTDPPEVHMKQDGAACQWDQNQPEAWGELLIAIGLAKTTGVVPEYSSSQTEFIKNVTDYLIRIRPWKFKGAGMWEGLPAHSPSSRSSTLAIAKGLDAVSSLFGSDPFFQKRINDTVEKSMQFVKADMNTDYTMPSGHPDGADLAMIVSMALPGTSKTRLPFVQYVEDKAEKLQIGKLPGAIRYVGDNYKRGEMGEARWFMADPVLALGYFREARGELKKGLFENAKNYSKTAESRLNQAIEISRHYGYYPELFPELFIPQDSKRIKNFKALIKNDREKTVALVPLERSLIWNSALVMQAASEALRMIKLELPRFADSPYLKAA